MLPVQLQAEQFREYPAEARSLAVAHLATIEQLPLSFLPSLLRELIEYDYKFPVERAGIEGELTALSALKPPQRAEWFAEFSHIRLSPALEKFDWVNQPAQFTEVLSAHLWATHQMDAFREAATAYGNRLRAAVPAEPLAMRRLGIAVIGQGAASYDAPLFLRLREHGTYFANVNPEDGLAKLLAGAAARAQAHAAPYGHWYVDGGVPAAATPSLTCVSYAALAPVREALLRTIQKEISKPGMGPEELRTYLARLSPGELGMHGDPVLDRFQVKLLTEGSGTQIFSTTFAQWTAREALRRAQALTLLVRFAPRQRQRPMNELLASDPANPELDPVGSVIDADMGAYYQWINQQRLPGSEKSAFLVWFEGSAQAMAIGPTLPRGAKSSSKLDLEALLALTIA
jgi:hypothetical protein